MITIQGRPHVALLLGLAICSGVVLLLSQNVWACFSLRGQQEYETKPSITRKELLYIALTRLQLKERDEEVLTPAREGLRFLVENMPSADLGVVSADTLARITLSRVKRRLHEREAWFDAVPWEVFFKFTLPYAVLSEPRDESLSEPFLTKLREHVDQFVSPGASLRDAITALNLGAFSITSPPIQFKAAPPNKVNAYSPFQVVRDKQSSCTGESVFLVYALREAGIPARVAGVPHWNRGVEKCPEGDRSPACGNHNWVEAFTEKGWVFLDQNTPNPPNKGWFFPELTNELVPGDWFHAVYASTWRTKAKMHFPLVFDPTYLEVSAIERTSWYQKLKELEEDDAENLPVISQVA